MSVPYRPTLTHPGPPVSRNQSLHVALTGSDPQQVTTERALYRSVNLAGFKADGSSNDNSVFVGFGAGLATPYEVPPGGSIVIRADAEGWSNDLSQLWVDGTSGDGLRVDYGAGLTNS